MDSSRHIHGWEQPKRRDRFAGLAVAVVLHAAALFALLQYEPVRSAFTQAMPIMVSLITPETVVEKPQHQPKLLPVKPRFRQQTPSEPKQLIAATTEEPAPALAPTSPPPTPQPVPVEAAPAPPPITTAPPPVVPPNFNADYLDNPPPAYPPLSKRMSEQGKVMLRVLVNAKGTPDKVELKSSSGSNRLDDAALETVKHWRFIPARQGDQPVPAWVLIPITFSLKG